MIQKSALARAYVNICGRHHNAYNIAQGLGAEPRGVLPTKSSRRAFVAESATTGTRPLSIAALSRSAAGGDPLYPPDVDVAPVIEAW